jgi:hypothetical protein
MPEVVTLFKQFIYRDLAFVLGGSIVLLSLAYAFRTRAPGCIPIEWQKDWKEFPTTGIVLIIVAAYVIGYAVQDVGAVLPLRLTSTSTRFEPKRLLRWLYERFSRVSWQATNYVGANDREFKFEIGLGRLEIPEDLLQALERIRSLKVISMCVGGCLFLSALVFAAQLVLNHRSIAVPCLAPSVARDWIILIGSALLAACLICLGWIKGMQEMQFYQSMHDAGFPLRPRKAQGAEGRF